VKLPTVRSRFAEWAGLDTKSMSFGVALTPESVDHRTLNPPELLVVMPCRNEEATVAACVEQIRSTVENNYIAGEIIVADNGSTDKSAEIALSPPAATTSRRFLYFSGETQSRVRVGNGKPVRGWNSARCDASSASLSRESPADRNRTSFFRAKRNDFYCGLRGLLRWHTKT
jgi:hypothetical protein